MADDGMLLNFAIGDSVIKPEAKFKGGRWRDRLTAKKRSQHHPNPNADPSKHGESKNPNHIQVPSTRPAKRQRTSDDAPGGGRSRGQHQPSQRKNPNDFVSSLFTKNPEAQNAIEPKTSELVEDAKPTNAPLIDGLDTFTNLGLSPNLAAHLLTKLELKAPTGIQKSSISQLLKEDSDAFIQAETGSGKTLAYLLPLVQRIMALSKATKEAGVHRDSGLFAIILAPTRELCKQISVVLENLLRCANWIVCGTVIGGEKKKSEKARLRKGLNILVATPGRLADHLDNTQVLDVSNVRWLVLDEGDRLMELGFEEELKGIVNKLDARQRPSRTPGVPTRRTTVLCSATLKMNVQRLGEISLKDAVHIKANPEDGDEDTKNASDDGEENFRVPAQLKQSYAIVAAKLRLVSLTAYLKRTFIRKGSVMKAIVFVSCADEVDFLFEVFSRKHGQRREDTPEKEGEKKSDDEEKKDKDEREKLSPHGTIAPGTAFSNPSNPVILHRLHGSLPQHVRTATLNSFSKSTNASVMVCTDVASRGLDLPNVDLVIEYTPAFSSDDHTHRIGRTARLGRDGRACIFLQPGSEENYVEVLKRGYRDGGKALTRTDATEILKRGFGSTNGSNSKNWEEKATDWQMDVERWAMENPEYLEMARRAYQSHIRAYATHIAAERSIFNIKELHLGHLAKSFALRDRPGKINVPGLRASQEETKKDFKAARGGAGQKRKAGASDDGPSSTNADDAARRMRAKMREHMAGANEFNLA
ncbi:P-loop containing nucleoside triphosphate hydrolase protein [Penicillium atrosanguineum]|uniref:P-loop containing nucleoside triphosphate hydrolase protein n=1 Tax=Penicillium atrosanguineum TaxID=1132637 RepID=UPI0023A430E3|nr:P-loop containing nucleoside triphosphate hydrolase protein [Penicillium atrosanguineum]KAJ5298356.1 P-loop containing nucleoside triphosphate hydrolase protein [Penicillium atrosanguineum]